MKPEQIYQELKELAEKMGITVKEQNLRSTGVNAQSGYCKIKGEQFFILDTHKSLRDKNDILASFLSEMPNENIFVVPAIRELVTKR